jgi:hypothetical protein
VSAHCSRPGCNAPADATLTYDYGQSVGYLDWLQPPHPMQYDLCITHADRIRVPVGWELQDRRTVRIISPSPERHWLAS